MTGHDYKRRLGLLKKELAKQRLDALLVTNEANVRYLSGFEGHDSMVLITAGRSFFITDSRYIEEAEAGIRDYSVELVKASTYETLKALLARSGAARVGFEPMDIPYEVAHRLKGARSAAGFIPAKGFVEKFRRIKDAHEVKLLRNSIKLVKAVFSRAIKHIRPGIREDFISNFIEIEFLKNGARSGFEPIVASGANSSKPHARTSAKRIENNSFVKIDIGCTLDGYNSDITRMILLGKPNWKFNKIYEIVRAAQELAVSAVRPGRKFSDLDAAARSYIASEGFGKCFGHALGHGVGLEVHEEPSISPGGEGVIAPGMAFTLEPAIYIPGFGGVRIEDMVLVTDKGCEVLTR